jgi:predicted enzyme related to lactoylglutathione lyase
MQAAAMSFRASYGPRTMSTSTHGSTTVSNLGVAMFTVADQDAALAFYTEKLGWEVRSDMSFGESGEMRWLEVAPPGSTARLALNPPMRDQPGGGSIGVETPDMRAEHERLSATDGVTITTEPMDMGGAPPMFSIADPDGNNIWVVQT